MSTRASRARRAARRGDRAGHRPVLLRGRRGRCRPVSRALRRRRRSADGNLDLWTAAERALRAAGVARVERLDLCTACDPERFFSHRRDGRRHRRPGSDRLCRLTRSARTTSAIQPRSAPGVTVVAATKYVAARRHARARRRGHRSRRREPRAGPRGEARSTTATRSAGTSSAICSPNKVKVVNRHLRARALARLRLGRAPPDRSGPRRGEPGGRVVEVRHRARTTCRASSSSTVTCAG